MRRLDVLSTSPLEVYHTPPFVSRNNAGKPRHASAPITTHGLLAFPRNAITFTISSRTRTGSYSHTHSVIVIA